MSQLKYKGLKAEILLPLEMFPSNYRDYDQNIKLLDQGFGGFI